MTSSLVGSEMCIRDRTNPGGDRRRSFTTQRYGEEACEKGMGDPRGTVSYTHLTLPTICSV
eukprot:8444612-Prorocentrum_lima.AAC.1